MTIQSSPAPHDSAHSVQEAPTFELDFDSDEPLPICPMRKDGSSPDEACEACQ
jgi:hypothetical protein